MPTSRRMPGIESTDRRHRCLGRFGQRTKGVGGWFLHPFLSGASPGPTALRCLAAAAVFFLSGHGYGAAAGTPEAPIAVARPAARTVYRIETSGQGVLWSSDRPSQSGDLILFHLYPAGTLMSVRRSDVKRVVAGDRERLRREPDYVDVGVTGPGSARKDLTVGRAPGRGSEALPPGERKDGTALLNPDRKYQPDIDSKQVPGLNLGYPAAPNDYREGKTFAYPAAPAVQSAPGEPPKMPEPKGPN